MNTEQQTEICCPPMEPSQWDEKEFRWDDKIFLFTKVSCLMYMPLNFGAKMRKLVPKIEAAGVEMPDGMVLSEQTSAWKMNLYICVNKAVPGIKNVTITGNFISKVYEGPYKNVGKWCKKFDSWVKHKGHTLKKSYIWYTYCPKCAKKYGKNYMVFIAEI